jgi:hypothetical protein
MALAVRRLLLRPNRYNYHRSNLAVQQLCRRILPASHQRQFHLCEPKFDEKKSASSQSDSLPKPDENQEASASTISQTDIEVASREWVKEFYQRIDKTGDIGAVLDMLDDEALSEKERGEVLSMVNELQGLDAEATHYKNLVDAIVNAPKNPAALDALLTSMGQDPKELLQGLSEEENTKLAGSDTDPEEAFNLEAAVLEALDEAFEDGSKLPSVEQLENVGKLDTKEILERQKEEKGDVTRNRVKMSVEDIRKVGRQWARDKRIEQMFGVENKPDMEQEKDKPGFWNDGDLDSDMGEDEEFAGDDITAQGHAELERHREMREYARLAVWELPLLSSRYKVVRTTSPANDFRTRKTVPTSCERSSPSVSIYNIPW